jgi:uncharacterized small protein (DUF1192 family)
VTIRIGRGLIAGPVRPKFGRPARFGAGEARIGRGAMPVVDEDQPRRKMSHEIGQDLAALSLDELAERIALLRSEIERIEAAIRAKQASAVAADAFFKR